MKKKRWPKIFNLNLIQIAKEEVKKAQKILDEIKPLIAQRQTVEEQRRKKEKPQYGEKLFTILEKIYGLSTEYYYLMPKKGFEFTRYLNSVQDFTSLLDLCLLAKTNISVRRRA